LTDLPDFPFFDVVKSGNSQGSTEPVNLQQLPLPEVQSIPEVLKIPPLPPTEAPPVLPVLPDPALVSQPDLPVTMASKPIEKKSSDEPGVNVLRLVFYFVRGKCFFEVKEAKLW